MPHYKTIAARLVLAVGALASFAAVAQMNTGTTSYNIGSGRPEWWTDLNYNPLRLEGAVHLRLGSAGNFSGRPISGKPTCDLAMLYAAKSHTALTAGEMEHCALLEYEISRGVNGTVRNLNDAFVRKDTVTEFSETVKRRIDMLRKNNHFYLRAAGIQLEAFDLKLGGIPVRANWTQGYIPMDPKVGRPLAITYRFDEPRFRKDDDRWWRALLKGDEKTGREMEAARAAEKFVIAQNYFTFEVTGVSEVSEWSGINRYVKVQLKRFLIPYTTEDGRTVFTAVSN